MKKEIKQFQKCFINYAKNCGQILCKREKDMFRFYNDEPIVLFQFGGEQVFIKWLGEKRFFVGYLRKINDREEFDFLKEVLL